MAKQREAVNEENGVDDTAEDGNDGTFSRGGRENLPAADLLDYMSDMLMELTTIADQNKWRTLSGLLALARAEAAVQRDEVVARRSR